MDDLWVSAITLYQSLNISYSSHNVIVFVLNLVELEGCLHDTLNINTNIYFTW